MQPSSGALMSPMSSSRTKRSYCEERSSEMVYCSTQSVLPEDEDDMSVTNREWKRKQLLPTAETASSLAAVGCYWYNATSSCEVCRDRYLLLHSLAFGHLSCKYMNNFSWIRFAHVFIQFAVICTHFSSVHSISGELTNIF